MSQREELKKVLISAMDEPYGVLLSVSGNRQGKLHLALAALNAAKRDLALDFPSILELTFRSIPAKSQIAIIRLNPAPEEIEGK